MPSKFVSYEEIENFDDVSVHLYREHISSRVFKNYSLCSQHRIDVALAVYPSLLWKSMFQCRERPRRAPENEGITRRMLFCIMVLIRIGFLSRSFGIPLHLLLVRSPNESIYSFSS